MVDYGKYELRKRGRLKRLGRSTSTVMWNRIISFKHFENGMVIKPYLQEPIILTESEVRFLNKELTGWINRQKLLEEI